MPMTPKRLEEIRVYNAARIAQGGPPTLAQPVLEVIIQELLDCIWDLEREVNKHNWQAEMRGHAMKSLPSDLRESIETQTRIKELEGVLEPFAKAGETMPMGDISVSIKKNYGQTDWDNLPAPSPDEFRKAAEVWRKGK